MNRDEAGLTNDEYDFAFMCLVAGPKGCARFMKEWRERFGSDFGEVGDPPDPLIIGSEPDVPTYFEPDESIWPSDAPPEQATRVDLSVPAALIAIGVALTLCYWLAHGGEYMVTYGSSLIKAALIGGPIVLCLLAALVLYRSLVSEWETFLLETKGAL